MTREEAIEVYNGLINTKIKEAFEFFAPELRESEDERIRKDIVAAIEMRGDLTQGRKSEIYAYLEKQKINTEGDFGRGYDCGYEACLNSHGAEWFEKQKEQKPAEWSEEDEKMLEGTLNSLRRYQLSLPNFQVELQIRWLKSLRPQPKRDGGDDYNKGYIKGMADTLKEFNDKTSWKPSEEQMRALERASKNEYLSVKQFDILISLYEDLKKLM